MTVIKRKTNFYGYGTPLEVLKNGQKIGQVRSEKSFQFQGNPGDKIQVKQFLLRSKEYEISANENLKVTSNSNFFLIGIFLFVILIVFSALKMNLLGIGVLVLAYFGFYLTHLNTAFIISKEE